LKLVQSEAERALHDGPDVAEAHMAMGLYHYWGFLDYQKALTELDLAEASKPSDGDVLFFKGVVLRRKGDWRGGLDYIQRAVTVDPRSTSKLLDLAATLEVFNRYDEALRVIQRAQLVNPDSPAPILYEGFHRVMENGDTAAAETAFRRLARLPNPDAVAASAGFGNAFLVTNSTTLQDLAFSASRESFGQASYRLLLMRAEAHDQRGDFVAAKADADSARAILERILRTEDDDWNIHQLLARAYVVLGRQDDALREANRATELLPTSKDAVSGPFVTWIAALVHVRTGDTAGALDRLDELQKAPAMWISPSVLRTSRGLAPLRGNPRFQRLLSQQPPVPQ
jgi:serine/threonine-protein kinase